MKPRWFQSLAAISIVLTALPAGTARRPRYGGILRLEIGAAVASLDPSPAAQDTEVSRARKQLYRLASPEALPQTPPSSAVALSTGPFRVVEWEAGRNAIFAANDNYIGGRPFIDSIEIRMGRGAKDRLLDLEANKADLAEIPVEEVRLATERGLHVSVSQPDELMALVFRSKSPIGEDPRVREAIAQVIDRASIANFILQKVGEPAGGLLPQWCNGTALLFSTAVEPSKAKEQWARIGGPPKILLGYDSGDALEQAVAERIAVNAGEAGIGFAPPRGVTPPTTMRFDARVVRMRMNSSHPRAALAGFLETLTPLAGIDATPIPDDASAQQIYERERAIISTHRIVPIVWLPEVYGLGDRVRNWKPPAPGETWPLADIWLEGDVREKASPQ